jgi:hypothetical protein
MICEAIKWLETRDFKSFLSFIIIVFEANNKNYLKKIWEPFYRVAEHNKEFCNFFLLMIQKIETESEEGKRNYSLKFKQFLTELRQELSTILANFKE